MEKIIELTDMEEARLVGGPRDLHLKLVRDSCGVRLVARNGILKLDGEPDRVKRAGGILEQMTQRVRRSGRLAKSEVLEIIYGEADGVRPDAGGGQDVAAPEVSPATPRSAGQRAYIEAMATHDVVFCIGPAGTGKTFLAVAAAVGALRADRVRKIVLVRPVVEAGEKLGFLPGDIQAKVNPFIRPLYDALSEFIEYTRVRKYIERDLIEIAPLAYMRGRTLNDAFVILDEAQNTSAMQMKMFLTRLGENSKMVITGDVTQIDLPDHQTSGLLSAERLLKKIGGISFIYLGRSDIVRHRIVKEIVDAYEHDGRSK